MMSLTTCMLNVASNSTHIFTTLVLTREMYILATYLSCIYRSLTHDMFCAVFTGMMSLTTCMLNVAGNTARIFLTNADHFMTVYYTQA